MEHDDSLSPTFFPSERRLSTAHDFFTTDTNTTSSHRQMPSYRRPRTGPLPRRYPGDGLDFRRPGNMSYRPTPFSPSPPPRSPPDTTINIIDLTSDDAGPSSSTPRRPNPPPQRQPRFARNIMDTQEVIDLENEENEGIAAGRYSARRPVDPSDSPDIEFVSSRPAPPRSRRTSDNDVQITGSAPAPDRPRPTPTYFGLPIQVDPTTGQRQNPFLRLRDEFLRIANGPLANAPLRYNGPLMELNYETVGFRLYEDTPVPQPAAPTYNPPKPASEGFTRTVKEDDTLVCPNCEEELCQGDTDSKKQVWIVKACGHVS